MGVAAVLGAVIFLVKCPTTLSCKWRDRELLLALALLKCSVIRLGPSWASPFWRLSLLIVGVGGGE